MHDDNRLHLTPAEHPEAWREFVERIERREFVRAIALVESGGHFRPARRAQGWGSPERGGYHLLPSDADEHEAVRLLGQWVREHPEVQTGSALRAEFGANGRAVRTWTGGAA